MKVFISWSKPRSRAFAEVLHKLLPDILQGWTPFMSKLDINAGERWRNVISGELAESQIGILCVSPENEHEDWLLFEAGAIAKLPQGKPCAICLGGLSKSNLKGPFSEFQHTDFDREEMLKLFLDLNSYAEDPQDDKQIERLFGRCWTEIESGYEEAMAIKHEKPEAGERSPEDMLEEVLDRVRSIDQRARHAPIDKAAFKYLVKEHSRGIPEARYEKLLKNAWGNIGDGRGIAADLPPLQQYSFSYIDNDGEKVMLSAIQIAQLITTKPCMPGSEGISEVAVRMNSDVRDAFRALFELGLIDKLGAFKGIP